MTSTKLFFSTATLALALVGALGPSSQAATCQAGETTVTINENCYCATDRVMRTDSCVQRYRDLYGTRISAQDEITATGNLLPNGNGINCIITRLTKRDVCLPGETASIVGKSRKCVVGFSETCPAADATHSIITSPPSSVTCRTVRLFKASACGT